MTLEQLQKMCQPFKKNVDWLPDKYFKEKIQISNKKNYISLTTLTTKRQTERVWLDDQVSDEYQRQEEKNKLEQ